MIGCLQCRPFGFHAFIAVLVMRCLQPLKRHLSLHPGHPHQPRCHAPRQPAVAAEVGALVAAKMLTVRCDASNEQHPQHPSQDPSPAKTPARAGEQAIHSTEATLSDSLQRWMQGRSHCQGKP